MELRRFLTILTVFVVIILTAMAWLFPENEDYHVDNPSWNGLEDMNSIMLGSPLGSLSDLPVLPHDSTLILIPYLDFSSSELNEINSFVAQGGTLVLADDYGHGNQVLEYLGLRTRFSGFSLIDPWLYYGNHWFPRITHVIPSLITSNIEGLLFNHATGLIDVDTSDVLALSSVFSFIDLNINGHLDDGEPSGQQPVISLHNHGSGKIILISDPSIFINSMLNFEDNLTFVENIATITPSGLFIDQSHLPKSNLNQTKNWLATIRYYISTPLGAISLVILALAITLMPIWHRRRQY